MKIVKSALLFLLGVTVASYVFHFIEAIDINFISASVMLVLCIALIMEDKRIASNNKKED